MIKNITFSPTGGTKKVADAVCKGICENTDNQIENIELCVPENQLSNHSLTSNDVAVIAMPVYAGRVPALAVERLRRITSQQTPCILIAVYGNRAFEDALVEMEDAVKEQGFQVLGAIAAVAEHSIFRQFGHARPDAADVKQLMDFGRQIVSAQPTQPSIPGHRPYKEVHGSSIPVASHRCINCGLCASVCPVQAIDQTDCRIVDAQQCIGCMKCVSVCPSEARDLPAEHRARVESLIREACRTRKENELFI